MNVRRTTLLCLWLCLLTTNAALSAQPRPLCVQVTLPDSLQEAPDWRAQLELQTATLQAPSEDSACAQLQVIEEDGLAIVARYQRREARSVLTFDDVPALHHARVAALIAESLLRSLLEPAPRTSADQPTPPAPVVQVAGEPAPSPELRNPTVHLQLGTRAFSALVPPLGRAELLFQWTRAQSRLRYAAGIVSDLTSGKAEQGRLIAATVGVRAGVAWPLLVRRRVRLWLGPSVETGALITSADARGPGGNSRHVRVGAVSLDLRMTAELGRSPRARALLSLDLGGVLRALRLRADDSTLLAYRGAYVGLALGSALAQ